MTTLLERYDILRIKLIQSLRYEQPRAWVSLDVWSPSGRRAVQIFFD